MSHQPINCPHCGNAVSHAKLKDYSTILDTVPPTIQQGNKQAWKTTDGALLIDGVDFQPITDAEFAGLIF